MYIGKFKGFFLIFFFTPNFFVIEFLGKKSQTMSKIIQIYNKNKQKIPNFFGKN
jgi:hypothetical protein